LKNKFPDKKDNETTIIDTEITEPDLKQERSPQSTMEQCIYWNNFEIINVLPGSFIRKDFVFVPENG
jgi:hypothetical protein